MKKFLTLACATLLSAGVLAFNVHTASAQTATPPNASQLGDPRPSYDEMKTHMLQARDEIVTALTSGDAVALRKQLSDATGKVLNDEQDYRAAKAKNAGATELDAIANRFADDIYNGAETEQKLASRAAQGLSNLMMTGLFMQMSDAQRWQQEEPALQTQMKPVEAAMKPISDFDDTVKTVVDAEQAALQARVQSGQGVDRTAMIDALKTAGKAYLDSLN